MSYTKNAELGFQVHQHLLAKGCETPFSPQSAGTQDTDSGRDKRIAGLFYSLLQEIGMDLEDDSISGTPRRLAKMYSSREILAGMDYANFPDATAVENKMGYDGILVERNIEVKSMCEHHFQNIAGSAFVAYKPSSKVLGLSKFNRIVDFFSRRPQIQERLTLQIYWALAYILETPDVAVLIQADHHCVKHRGVQDPCSDTTTSKLGGIFMESAVKAEFFELSRGFRT